MKTIAIVSISKKHSGDVFNTVLGLDMTMEEAPENGEVFQWYDEEITLPEFWLETADSKDVIKEGKEC